MSRRFRRFFHSLASGYGVLVVSAAYSLGSIPLALHYLSHEDFGIWVVVSQVVTYLAFVDAGVSPSVWRILIDAKDNHDSEDLYGTVICTGLLTQTCIGLFLMLLGVYVFPCFGPYLGIPESHDRIFRLLVGWQSVVTAVSLPAGTIDQILMANQRQYIINYGRILRYTVALGALFVLLRAGGGVLSLLIGGTIAWGVSFVFSFVACTGAGILPSWRTWRFSFDVLRQILTLGRDMVIVAAGAQMILLSQVLVISHVMGVAAATLWIVATKVFTFLAQSLYLVFDTAMPAFAEMMVRGEWDRLKERFRELVVLTGVLASVAAPTFMFLNSPFLVVWTGGRVGWPFVNDMLLGVWLLLLSVFHCHVMLVIASKEIRFMRYIYILEGGVGVLASVLAASRFGMTGMIVCYLVLAVLMHGFYGIRRTSQAFRLSLVDVGLRWQGKAALAFVLQALCLAAVSAGLPVGLAAASRLVLLATVAFALGAALVFTLGLKDEFRGLFRGRMSCLPPDQVS